MTTVFILAAMVAIAVVITVMVGSQKSGYSGLPGMDGWQDQKKPRAPRDSDFRAAGVSIAMCSKCGKELKARGYFFGLDGKPAVFCPGCWAKATGGQRNVKYSSPSRDKFFARLTTLFEVRDL
jgi:hypothetical protein